MGSGGFPNFPGQVDKTRSFVECFVAASGHGGLGPGAPVRSVSPASKHLKAKGDNVVC